jgi:RNA polymerase sigma-70 factor (ECF subfamily)
MLVRHYERPIFSFMVRHRLDRTTSADLTQEAFLKAFRSIDSFKPERASFKTWLYTISYNLIRDNARRMDVRSRGAEELQRAHEAAPPTRSHAEVVADSDEVERLLDLVDEEARGLLVLRFLQEVPYNEISEITGMPAATLRSKVHRALKRLQAQLSERQEAGS